jgi:hypothetical protein
MACRMSLPLQAQTRRGSIANLRIQPAVFNCG